MFLPQLVQDVGRIEASVVAKLPCDHLKCLGNSSTSGDNRVVLHCTPDDHDGVMEGSLGLLHELLSAPAEDDCAGLRLGTATEQVEPLATNLLLLECLAGSQSLVVQ